MFLSLILSYLLHINHNGAVLSERHEPPGPAPRLQPHRCLTGYMTDVQSWVDENGDLTSNVDFQNTIDVSLVVNVVPAVYQQIQVFRNGNRSVRFLSLAKCELNRVPSVFQLRDTQGRTISETVEYITFYGNDFIDVSSPGEQYDVGLNATGAQEMDMDFTIGRPVSVWSSGLQQTMFRHLLQLDLRRCSIQTLTDNLFQGMPKLEALYLGENSISVVNTNAFFGLRNLLHLDLSRNSEGNGDVMVFSHPRIFVGLTKLISLDLSFTRLMHRNVMIFSNLGRSFQRLSLCQTGLPRLADSIFNGTSLTYLDVSGNNGILTGHNVLAGTEDTLKVVYADEISLKTFDVFYQFSKLEILKVTNNEVTLVTSRTARTLTNLKILDLSNNRLSTWFSVIFKHMPQLQYLSLKDNNINLISIDMIRDFKNITYLALSGNFFVCNCHTRELFELALRNEEHYEVQLIAPEDNPDRSVFKFHIGFIIFNGIIEGRKTVTKVCNEKLPCEDYVEELEVDGNFVLVDFEMAIYQCLMVSEGKSVAFSKVETCQQQKRDIDVDDMIKSGLSRLLALLVIPTLLFPILISAYMFRRRIKYFFVTMRNSAMLSMINKKEDIDDNTIFNYDVFVSYCNEDRNWVLDYLLPHVEKDCNVSVCLHERDFQVGLSILENIVSCMDRSRSIMLVISKRFLLSQWCQFEMHLAQHRLLETRREDLILVLLEEIPRRLRPTTLHYLMLTKTYIVWPTAESDQPVFWRRLKKSLVTYRLKQTENISLA